MVDLRRYSSTLSRGDDGVWRAATRAPVSYPEHGNEICFQVEEGSFWFLHRNRCIVELIRRHPPESTDPIFDIGGGNGFVALAVQNSGHAAVVVEPGPSGARNASSRGVEYVVEATLETAGFRPGSLPAVGLFDVVEHIEEDAAFLTEVHGVLAPQGTLFLTVPAQPLLWSRDDVEAGHFRRYTISGLGSLLERVGFEVVYASYFFKLMPIPILLLRSLPSRLGLRGHITSKVTQSEHRPRKGWTGRFLQWSLDKEVDRIQQGLVMHSGSSCLVAARKT